MRFPSKLNFPISLHFFFHTAARPLVSSTNSLMVIPVTHLHKICRHLHNRPDELNWSGADEESQRRKRRGRSPGNRPRYQLHLSSSFPPQLPGRRRQRRRNDSFLCVLPSPLCQSLAGSSKRVTAHSPIYQFHPFSSAGCCFWLSFVGKQHDTKTVNIA